MNSSPSSAHTIRAGWAPAGRGVRHGGAIELRNAWRPTSHGGAGRRYTTPGEARPAAARSRIHRQIRRSSDAGGCGSGRVSELSRRAAKEPTPGAPRGDATALIPDLQHDLLGLRASFTQAIAFWECRRMLIKLSCTTRNSAASTSGGSRPIASASAICTRMPLRLNPSTYQRRAESSPARRRAAGEGRRSRCKCGWPRARFHPTRQLGDHLAEIRPAVGGLLQPAFIVMAKSFWAASSCISRAIRRRSSSQRNSWPVVELPPP